jgi:hypothetical protein
MHSNIPYTNSIAKAANENNSSEKLLIERSNGNSPSWQIAVIL